jgi:TIR domain
MPDRFDVFLSHDSRDKPIVEEIAARLRERGVTVWLDRLELQPGLPWQEGLEEGIRASRAVAVFIGAEGLGAWETPEMRAFIDRSRRERVPVIPVLLPGSPETPRLPLFLEAFTWVDLRRGVSDEGIARLAWGITGARRESETLSRKPKTARAWWIAAAGLALGAALGLWLWQRAPSPPPPPPRPDLYAVRVQVLDPQGQPVGGSRVRASAGNEPQRTPDGWWEIEIPRAKVPAGGRVTIWAEQEEWRGSQADLILGTDANPGVKIHLQEPESWIRGRVVDSRDRLLTGARVSSLRGGTGFAVTDATGHFALKVALPPEEKVRMQVEHGNLVSTDDFCYTGRDGCEIVLEKR